MSGATRLPETVQTIPDALAFWARERPSAPALIGPGEAVVSYAEFSAAGARIAATLRNHGVRRGSVVVVLVPDGPLLAAALLGAASAASAFPLDVSVTAPELVGILARIDAGGAILASSCSAAVRDCLNENRVPVFGLEEEDRLLAPLLCQTSTGHGPAQNVPRPSDIAVIGQTSGTTGKSKLVPRTHAQIIRNGRHHRDLFGLTVADRALAVAPMSLSLGKTALMHSLAAGSSLIFPTSFAPQHIRDAITRDEPTWMHAAAGFLEVLARHLRKHPPRAASSLRLVRVTAAAISPAVCEDLERFLGAPVLPAYSTSETGVVATNLPRDGLQKRGSVGKPVQEVRVVDDAGEEVTAGEEGEIWIRGEKVIGGYVDDLALDARAFMPDGWFRIGDIGFLDDDGFLFLTGRVNELINRGGIKIAPSEVDAVLAAHPALRLAATFAVPDERLGEDIVAAVVPEPGQEPTARELRAWMLDQLAAHKVPRRIWFVEDERVPRTASGKVRRAELASQFAGQVVSTSVFEGDRSDA